MQYKVYTKFKSKEANYSIQFTKILLPAFTCLQVWFSLQNQTHFGKGIEYHAIQNFFSVLADVND